MHSPSSNTTMWSRLKDYSAKPPIIFPLAASFQCFITLDSILRLYPTPINQPEWLSPLSLLIHSILGLALLGMRKRTAIAYIVVTILAIGLSYLAESFKGLQIMGIAMFPFNVIVSFFILLYYKKFNAR